MMVKDDVMIGGVVVILVGSQMFLRVGMRVGDQQVLERLDNDIKVTLSEVAVVCDCEKGMGLRAKLRSVGGEVVGSYHGMKQGEIVDA